MKVRFVCLANSKRESGRCIAGIRTDGGGWFRPVSNIGPLNRQDCQLQDGSDPRLLDIIEVDVIKPTPELYQPENWEVGNAPWHLIDKLDPSNAYTFLKDFIYFDVELIRNTTEKVSLSQISENPIKESLALVVPQNISWFITRSRYGHRQTRAQFSLEQTYYDLSITDPIWEKRLEHLDIRAREAAEVDADVSVLFTISLAGPYYEKCYKLIAGILEIPRKSIYLIDLLTERKVKFIDMRPKGGALWLIGGEELSTLVSELQDHDILFKYSPSGGKASGYSPAWFYKEEGKH